MLKLRVYINWNYVLFGASQKSDEFKSLVELGTYQK